MKNSGFGELLGVTDVIAASTSATSLQVNVVISVSALTSLETVDVAAKLLNTGAWNVMKINLHFIVNLFITCTSFYHDS